MYDLTDSPTCVYNFQAQYIKRCGGIVNVLLREVTVRVSEFDDFFPPRR